MAQTRRGILFGAFRLDVADARLWRGDEAVALQPRPLAVLSYLASRPGLVVSRDELIAALWADTHVTKAVLKVAVRAIREAIDDDADAPRFLETVGREGYRFIGGLDAPVVPRLGAAATAQAMVGRDEDLARLHGALARALGGERTLVFVSGEAGIGKTTLLDRFVAAVARAGAVRVARGQCLDQYGEGEAYLPVLEALGALARDDPDGSFAATLRRHAPSWVPHLAALDPAPRARAGGGAAAAMPERMLRELADALEVLTRERALLLVLDDLQWSDRASVDLLACLARRRQPARLLVVGSLRPGDMKASDHPLCAVQHDLRAKGLCEEIALGLLSRDDVAAYVAARFGGAAPSALRRLAARVHARTEGNALFMINMVNDLVAAGLLAWRDGGWRIEGSIESATDGIPSGLQELLGRRLRGLAPAQRRVLEAASVAGEEFAVAAVAAALQADPGQVEDLCEQLAAADALIVDAGVAEWPDGSVSGRYRFQHALYRRVLYEGIAAARRVRLHRAIGRREEAGFGDRAGEHAAELAMHYSRGRAYPGALEFHQLAVGAALDRHAPHEAVAHCGAALEALDQTPDTPGRARRELGLVVTRATLLMAIQGYAAPATEQAFAHARRLCDALRSGPQRFSVLRGLLSYHQVRAELDEAHVLGEQLLRLAARRPNDALLRVQAHYGAGTTLFHRGALGAARVHLETALRHYAADAHRDHILLYGGYDPGVACALWLAWTLILQGEVDAGMERSREGLALAHRHGEAFTLAWAHQATGTSHQLLGQWAASEAASTDAMRLAEAHGFPHVLGMATANRGWARLMQGATADGAALLREGVALVEQTGARLVRPSYLGMLAAAHALEGDRARGAACLDAALAEMERSGERLFEAALRVQQSRFLADGGSRRPSPRAAAAAADDALRRALDIARAQGARLLELRVALAIAARYRHGGRDEAARELLTAAHAWFAPHPAAAPEIAAARALLAELGA